MLALLLLAGCDHGAPATTVAPSCPPCQCHCTGGDTPAAGGGSDRGGDVHARVAALSDSLTRKAAKRDGKGCLEDLDALARLDAATAKRMSFQRGQCLMLAGRCDDGKQLVRDWFADTTSQLPETIDRSVEATASMYCEGSMSDRDALLKALMDLQQGAYQGNIGIRACNDAIARVDRFRKTVRPKNDEDTQVAQLDHYFYHTAASCLARAGDCRGAWEAFQVRFPADVLKTVTDPAVRANIIETSFDSVVQKCKGKR